METNHRRFVESRTRKERRLSDAPGPVQRTPIDRRSSSLLWMPLFRGASEQAIEEAIGESEIFDIAPGVPLLQKGQHNDSVYFALSGQVSVYLDFEHNPESHVPLEQGECIGELSAIDGQPVSALVMTRSPARMLKIPGHIFWNQLMTVPGIAANFNIMLSGRVRRISAMALLAQQKQMQLEHLQKELNLARQLQASMLPLQRPLFEGRMDLDICGFMEPASNVGGDLFDAFFTRENELFFCIGDVSGHGIASALFMARTVGLVRTLALGTPQPHILLGLLNDSLCQANDTNIFVTMFCGLLQVDTGVLTYSNGGHCPPMVVSKGIPHMLPLPKGPLIGAIPGARFLTLEANLEIGDTLFCYTDGVTEAENPQGQEFSEEKCQSIVAEQPLLPIDALLGRVRSSVATFTETSVLEDDCTMLALRRLPSP